jgi:hypothetical protein
MDILSPCCAGLDAHTRTIVLTVRRLDKGKVRQYTRTYDTRTERLLRLAGWLEADHFSLSNERTLFSRQASSASQVQRLRLRSAKGLLRTGSCHCSTALSLHRGGGYAETTSPTDVIVVP